VSVYLLPTDDGRKLFRDYGILAKNLVELGAVALVADPDSQIGKAKRKIVSLVRVSVPTPCALFYLNFDFVLLFSW
jgi:hypothetical protein